MAYLRRITQLPSGNISRYHVIGGPGGLQNLDCGDIIPYSKVRELLKGPEHELMGELEEKLMLNKEEPAYVKDFLYEERDRGEWEKKFDWEK